MFRALELRNYRMWALADLVSVTGTWMQVIALNWLVMSRTGSASAVGGAILLQALPTLLLGSWAGALADRFPARRILVITQGAHALLSVGMAVLAAGHAPLSWIFALTFGAGLVGVFDGPAMGRFGSQVVGREGLGNALALGSILSSAGRILGMSLAGVLVAVTGESVLFLLNAASFLVVIGAMFVVRPDELHPLATSTPERAGVRAGLRILLRDRTLLTLFALAFVLSSLGRNYQVTMAAMSQGPLGAGPAGYGMLSTVFAVGTVLGGILAAQRRELSVKLLLVAAGATSVLQSVSGTSGGLWTFAAFLVPIAAGAVIIDTTLSTRVQLDTAEDLRGRVVAAHGMVAAAAGAVGGPLLGWLCERFGPGHALESAGVVTGVATLVAGVMLLGRPQWLPRFTRIAPSTAPGASVPAVAAEEQTAPLPGLALVTTVPAVTTSVPSSAPSPVSAGAPRLATAEA